MNTSVGRSGKTVTKVASIGALAALVVACSGRAADAATASRSGLDAVVPAAPATAPDFTPNVTAPATESAPATDPVDAVRRYVDAEMNGDFDEAYSLLSSASQERGGSATDWRADASERPTIVGYEVDPAPAAADSSSAALVTGTLDLAPRLDEVAGYVPAHASVEWHVVREDDGWRVELADTSVRPILPDEDGASATAAEWAAARQRCRPDHEYAGSLLGSPVLGDRLCGLDGDVLAGPPEPLGDVLTAQVVAAFGPDATTWARSVALSGAAQLTVVTAPYGDEWVVVGVGT